MIPLRDIIPSRTTPVMTAALIAVNAAVFVYEQSLAEPDLDAFVTTFGLVPAAFSSVAVLTSMFLHGGWLHFLGNSLYLWIFGDNVEDRVGHLRFLAFYLVCGAVAALVQTAMNPGSGVPMVGASGAIAGVMGAYFVMFPHSRILTLIPILFFIQVVEIPAIFFLGIWFLMQLVSGVGSLGVQTAGDVGGIAFWAHIAGFGSGLIGIFLFRRPERQRPTWWDRA
jgi:membrane associated rhomboid family serine protease